MYRYQPVRFRRSALAALRLRRTAWRSVWASTVKQVLRNEAEAVKGIADIMVNRILADKDYGHSEVAVMINGLGATPLMELYILASDVHTRLCAEGLKPVKYYVGNYMTAIEMAGASCSILQLDEELKRLLEYPSNTPAFKEIG